MNEAGLYDYWEMEMMPNSSACKQVPTKITVSSSLSLRQCWVRSHRNIYEVFLSMSEQSSLQVGYSGSVQHQTAYVACFLYTLVTKKSHVIIIMRMFIETPRNSAFIQC